VRLPGRRGRTPEGALVPVEGSTLARAGDAATRLVLEETLLRRGWRVLFFEDHFGPLVGPQSSRLFDGVAVRARPGGEGGLELRLLRVESDTLDVPEELLERVRRGARGVSLEWLVAAFDGEAMRLVPELGDADTLPVRPIASPPAPPAGPATRAAAARRRSPPGRPADAPLEAAPARAAGERAQPSQPVPEQPGGGRRGRRRGGRGRAGGQPAEAAEPAAPIAQRAAGVRQPGRVRAPATTSSPAGGDVTGAGPEAPAPSPARRGRRRGKRGGRRRSGGASA
jgi:hypothetical protein